MGKCLVCGEKAVTISDGLGVCLNCIRRRPEQALEITRQKHAKSCADFGLPPEPPSDAGGLRCGICANDCVIGVSRRGFCGLVRNVNGHLIRYGGTAEKGVLQWYYDSLPTNCVSWWFCPGCTGRGYPTYAYRPEAEYGYRNLAVFYGACSYDCLNCQNWHYRKLSAKCKPVMDAEELASKVDEHVSCICYFGGDPSPQMPHSLEVSRLALEEAKSENRILRICWETNGYMNPRLAEKAAQCALESGGNMKFDLKAWDERLNVALCGVSNEPALNIFKSIGGLCRKRQDLPLLSASTLLIPGYVDVQEVEGIAKFIGEIDAEIPYTLLAFYPCYKLNDLPTTSKKQALDCKEISGRYLKNTSIGNYHLLQ